MALYCSYPFGAAGGESDAFGENGLRLAAAKLMIKLEMFQALYLLWHYTRLPTYLLAYSFTSSRTRYCSSTYPLPTHHLLTV